jgi:hypothetical protein
LVRGSWCNAGDGIAEPDHPARSRLFVMKR